jgi:hypothetical protein
MGGTIMVTVHRPDGMTEAAFLKKLQHEVFPAVHKGPTRMGEVDSWKLLSETDKGESSKYVWLINWGGLDGAGDKLIAEALVKLRGLVATVHETHYSVVDQST